MDHGWGRWDLPPAPPVRARRRWLWPVACVLLVASAAASFVVPMPMFYAYRPGPLQDLARLVNVDGTRTYSSEGSLYLTTVSLDPDLTVAEWVGAAFSPEVAVVPAEAVTGGVSLEEQIEIQRREMRMSQVHAEEVALGALGLGEPHGSGARVVATVGGTGADGVLHRGDVIVAVDGRRVSTTCDVLRAVERRAPGDAVDVAVERDGTRRRLSVRLTDKPDAPGTAFMGVSMTEVGYRLESGVEVDFDTGEIAGPSAGLMMALALYDRLTPDDITGGHDVAGTGTLSCTGRVGPIGGIAQKVVAAENAGADVFLAPGANAAAAADVAGDIVVVPVSTFDDAIEYLHGLDRGA